MIDQLGWHYWQQQFLLFLPLPEKKKKQQSNNGRQAPTALLSEWSVLAVAQAIETPAEMELPGSTRSQPPIDMTNLEVRFDAMCLILWDRFRWHHWKMLSVYTYSYLIVSWTQTGFMLFNCTPSKATVAFECTRFVRAYILFSRNPILAELFLGDFPINSFILVAQKRDPQSLKIYNWPWSWWWLASWDGNVSPKKPQRFPKLGFQGGRRSCCWQGQSASSQGEYPGHRRDSGGDFTNCEVGRSHGDLRDWFGKSLQDYSIHCGYYAHLPASSWHRLVYIYILYEHVYMIYIYMNVVGPGFWSILPREFWRIFAQKNWLLRTSPWFGAPSIFTMVLCIP